MDTKVTVIPTVKCPQCGVYRTPEVQNGRFYYPVCGEDVTEVVKEVDPELVERISHSSVHSTFDVEKKKK